MSNDLSKSIVFITGTFFGNNCWDDWRTYFEARGYRCIAPAWPHKHASPEDLRNSHPDSAIAGNTLDSLTEYFAEIVNALPTKPFMIGHSLGALIVQLLLQRDMALAGVAIHSFPPGGLLTKISFLKNMWSTMGLFTSPQKTYLISFRKWKRVIANGMTCEEQKQLYYKYATPESKLLIRDVFKAKAKINFDKKHPPLLLISGGLDKMISARLNFENYTYYQKNNSVIDYKNFNDRNHLVFGHAAWREEADFILRWLQGIKEHT